MGILTGGPKCLELRRRRAGPAARLAFVLSAVGLLLFEPTGDVQAQSSVDLSEIGYTLGYEDAPVTIVEFGDYACSACAEFHELSWPDVKRELIDSGVVLWRHVPFLLGFRRGEDGAKAAQCAADQGAFWEMHDRLFLRQKEWASQRKPKNALVEYATALALDGEVFRTCFEKNHPEDRIDAANDAAKELGIRVTPVFFIDGFRIQGALPADAFIELARAAQSRGGRR